MKSTIAVVLQVLFCGTLLAEGPGLEGTWKFVPGRSTDIASWNYALPQIEISSPAGRLRLIYDWLDRGKVGYSDTVEFVPGGGATATVTRSEVWPENWYMGVLASPGDAKTVSGNWLEKGRSLRTLERETLRTSQGKSVVTTTTDYTLAPDGVSLRVSAKRSSRPTPVVLVFERKEASR